MNLLLVEGFDDQHVLWNLLEARQFPERFDIKQEQGYDTLLKALPTRLKASDLERLGIIVDANDNPQGRWDAVRSRLPNNTLPVNRGPAGW